MTGVLLASLLGTFILAFVIALISQSASRSRQPAGIEDYSNARRALDAVSVDAAAIRRIFSEEDLKFALCSGQPDVQKLFMKERKRLAIQCLLRTQRRIGEIVDLHLRLASYTYAPRPGVELSLSAQYLNFLLVSNLVLLLLRLAGPFRTAYMISRTLRSAQRFCSMLDVKLDQLSRNRASFPVANLW